MNVTLAPWYAVVVEPVIAVVVAARVASQALAKFIALIEPSPVTWSYPVPALNPNWNGAVAGQFVEPCVQGTMLLPVVTSLKAAVVPLFA